jgi:cobyrinic acid a,c-diamide synthase
VNAGLTVAALGTGEGKTLVALGLARALARANYTVAPFKAGPDYLDARLYQAACGSRAINVDLWLDGEPRVTRALAAARERGCAVVLEGMMGLFDGDDAGETSTAHIAAAAGLPVVLVADGWRMSQSAAAAALGAMQMHPRVRIAGLILNRAGGASHAAAVRRACESAGVRFLAWLPHDPAWTLPERALGLDVRTLRPGDALLDAVADALDAQIDLGAWFGPPCAVADDAAANGGNGGPVVAYADDDALWFTYPQTLAALHAAGAHPVPFSPLHDATLPPRTAALWLGGGYPETHARELSENRAMRDQVCDAHASGVAIYAECGGMMYLGRSLATSDGVFPMAGVVRCHSTMADPRLTIGYRELRATRDSLLDRAGDAVRAYEFHYARAQVDELPAYEGAGDRGAWRERLVAGFAHRRFFTGDAVICRFVESLRS